MRNNESRELFLDFSWKLHLEGFPLTEGVRSLLAEDGYFSPQHIKTPKARTPKNKYIRPLLAFKNEAEQQADEKVTIIDLSNATDEVAQQVDVAISENDIGAIRSSGIIKYEGGIDTSQWRVPTEQLFSHGKDFYEWINSINRGFQYRTDYWRYNLYVQQANEWLSDKTAISDFESYESRYAFVEREKEKCKQNSLYALDRYVPYKDSKSASGFSQYEAHEAQRIAAFLVDSRYHLFFAKARQIFFTTTMFAIALIRTMYNKSFSSLIVTSDLKKAEKTFEEKVKAPYYAMPYYIKPSKPSYDTKMSFTFYKDKKEQEGAASTFSIENATPTVINSQSPDVVFIDEIGLIDCLTEMINEGRPAMVRYNPATKLLEPRGQFIAWGSSFNLSSTGEVLSNNPAFESEFRGAINAWEKGEFEFGMIPVFFNRWARAGMSDEFYDIEKKRFYSITGAKQESSRIQFHQSYPDTIDDMFIRNSQTIIPLAQINVELKRIAEAPVDFRGQYGWFEPELDTNTILPDKNSDVQFKVIGSRFVPAESPADPRVSAFIFRHPNPEEDWVNRYYKGTDPIANSSGRSRFSSAIWDNLDETYSAILNFRVSEHRYCFLQSLLMGIYYDPNIPELVESNIGQNYIDYTDAKGYLQNLIPNVTLPRHLQTPGGNIIGINKKGNTARFILNELVKTLDIHMKNIWIYEFFVQLKTFVRHDTANNPDNFKVDDPRYNFDDLIDAMNYAKICADCFEGETPRNLNKADKKRVRYQYAYDNDYNLYLKEEMV